jgi:predicted DNA-binding transcriptional regulator AlpA
MDGENEMMTLAATCAFFGGDRPIHYSTLYRGIAAGRYPKPIHIGPNSVRWLRSECVEAKRKMMEARDTSSAPVRRRGRPKIKTMAQQKLMMGRDASHEPGAR